MDGTHEKVWAVLVPGQTQLRVVSWNGQEAVLEKRQFFRDGKTGEQRPGRCKGLTMEDFEFVLTNVNKIREIFAEAK